MIGTWTSKRGGKREAVTSLEDIKLHKIGNNHGLLGSIENCISIVLIMLYNTYRFNKK